MDGTPGYVTVEQAARELAVPARTVRERVRRGLMAGVKLTPRMLLIPQGEVEAWRGRRPRPGRKPKQPTGAGEVPPLVARLDATRAAIARGRTFEDSVAVIRAARDERPDVLVGS